jgi:molybdopterin/thiamine biosynthesis adenylyltransferase
MGWIIPMLEQNELLRYQRQLVIPFVGISGQEKFKNSHILIAGMGGLGCTSANYLTAVGIGHITIVDFDSIELSDLNRQILYWEEDVGKKKVLVAQKKLLKLNPNIAITPVEARIDEKNVFEILNKAQVIIDGLDNMETRLILNSACVKLKKPYIYGGVSQLRGMITTIIPGETPCLACICQDGISGLGVLNMAPAIIANLQAIEAIKIILGQKPALAGKLLMLNGEDIKFNIYDIKRNANCNICQGI